MVSTFCPHPTLQQRIWFFTIWILTKVFPTEFSQIASHKLNAIYLRDVCSMTFICLAPHLNPNVLLQVSPVPFLQYRKDLSLEPSETKFHWKHWHTPEGNWWLSCALCSIWKKSPSIPPPRGSINTHMPTGQRAELTSRLRVWNVRSGTPEKLLWEILIYALWLSGTFSILISVQE